MPVSNGVRATDSSHNLSSTGEQTEEVPYTNERFEDAREIEITSRVTLVEVFTPSVIDNYLLRWRIVGKDRTCGRQVCCGNNQ